MDHISGPEKEEKEKNYTVNYTNILSAKRQIVQTPSIGHSSQFCRYLHYRPIFNISRHRYANPECDNNIKKGFQVISCGILIQENKSQEISVLLNDSESAKPSKLLFCSLSAKQLWQSYTCSWSIPSICTIYITMEKVQFKQ